MLIYDIYYYRNMELLQQKISKVATNIYALESMVYLTAGLMDAFDDQDVDMECAIVKYFALSSLWQTARLPMDFMGPEIFQSGQKTLNAMKDSAQLYIQGEPLDSVRLYIGLNGLQYSGVSFIASLEFQFVVNRIMVCCFDNLKQVTILLV